MYNTYLFDEEEYKMCKESMDQKTFKLFMEICDKYDSRGISLPFLYIVSACKNKGFFEDLYRRRDLRKEFQNYDGSYGQFYKVIPFVIYGYGNWSNNDRLRKGFAPIRFRRISK